MSKNELAKRRITRMLQFEKETGKKAKFKNGNITKGFISWLCQKIKYKDGLVCNDPTCSKFGQEFHSKNSFSSCTSYIGYI